MNPLLSIKKWIDAGGPRRKWYVGLSIIGIICTGILLGSGGSSSSTGMVEPDSLYFVGVIVKLVAVLLLIVGGALILRRFQIKGGFQRNQGRLNVVETIRLSQRQAIHLVRIGNQHVLIGATDQTITMLSSVDICAEDVQSTSPGQVQPSFSQTLQTLTASQASMQISEDEDHRNGN